MKRRNGFTLVELMVALLIIALVAVLVTFLIRKLGGSSTTATEVKVAKVIEVQELARVKVRDEHREVANSALITVVTAPDGHDYVLAFSSGFSNSPIAMVPSKACKACARARETAR